MPAPNRPTPPSSAAPALRRRSVLRGAGALVVSLGAPVALDTVLAARAALAQDAGRAGRPPVVPDQLDSYIAVNGDGTVTAFFGKIDGGQGLDVAVAQIVAEELDIHPDRVGVVMGDTAVTVNQGGASNASGVSQGAVPLRNAAAEARLALVGMASARLGEPAERLTVADGIVSVAGQPERRVAYAELIGGQFFNLPMQWNKRFGNDLNVTGRATPKPVADYKVVGTPQPRRDIPSKVFAQHEYATDVRVPGMLHARMIRPPVAGAVPTGVDEHSVADIPGIRVVWKEGFLAVLAPREWDAIQASRRLAVTWSDAPPPFPDQAALYDHIRGAPVQKRTVALQSGDAAQAIAGAAKTVAAEYRWPFQSHSSMGPACAVADVRDGEATLWTGTQKPHYARDGVAAILGLKPEKVHAVWRTGPGSYGRNDAGDAAVDAALLSREVGRPVRVQYMRHEGHAWDAKSPASLHRARAGLDADGRIVGLVFESKSFSRLDVASSEADPRDSLASQAMGGPLNPTPAYLFPGESVPAESYQVPNKLMAWEVIPPLLDRASPLRTSHLRDPLGPELLFASECFIDELAAAAGEDALAFRLRHLQSERDIAVLKAAAERASWQSRPSGPRDPAAHDDVSTGRGIALAHRDRTVVALVAEVEVERRTGRVRAKRMVVAHDCGLIVNPDGLRRCVENAVVYASSRALHEEVTFDRRNVTSVDWLTYPILDITEAPEEVAVVLINRPDVPPSGAGEPSVRAVGAAIGNAIFDATGVRLRQGPLTPERVKSALTPA